MSLLEVIKFQKIPAINCCYQRSKKGCADRFVNFINTEVRMDLLKKIYTVKN